MIVASLQTILEAYTSTVSVLLLSKKLKMSSNFTTWIRIVFIILITQPDPDPEPQGNTYGSFTDQEPLPCKKVNESNNCWDKTIHRYRVPTEPIIILCFPLGAEPLEWRWAPFYHLRRGEPQPEPQQHQQLPARSVFIAVDPDPGRRKLFVLDPDSDPKIVCFGSGFGSESLSETFFLDPNPSKSFGSIRIRFRNHCKNEPQ